MKLQHLDGVLGGAVHGGGVVTALASHDWAGGFHHDKLDSIHEDINNTLSGPVKETYTL